MSVTIGKARTAFAAAALVIVAVSPAHADVAQGLKALDEKKYEDAAARFVEALETGGEADGAFYMGRMLELGVGVSADFNAARAMYLTGAQKGSAAAKNRLGMMHVEGAGMLQDYEEGAKLICEAADGGDVNALYNCGVLYQEGKGVAADRSKATAYFDKAAAKDHIAAKNAFALALRNGDGVVKDEPRAIKLLSETAALGNPVGQYLLAQGYATGIGTEKDAIKAHVFFNLAAARQHPDAADARALVEKMLTPQQLQDAQLQARKWRPVTALSVTADAPAKTETGAATGSALPLSAKTETARVEAIGKATQPK